MNPKDRAAKSRVPMHLLPPIGPILGAVACGDGAKKYGPYNWREKPISYMEYLGAMQRHIARIIDGEDVDPDSGYPHEGNIIATATIIADARECGTLIDDRPKLKGGAARVLTDFQKRHIKIIKTETVEVMSHWLCIEHGRTEPQDLPCCVHAEAVTSEA